MIFDDKIQSSIAEQQRAELWMRMYQFAAEDFVNHQDAATAEKSLLKWCQSVEDRLNKLGEELASHTHEITPHTHPIPDHIHTVVPHTHICATPGSPTSPEVAPLSILPNGPKHSIINARQIQTAVAINSTRLRWTVNPIPTAYANLTTAVTNLTGNRLVTGVGVVGDAELHFRRQLPIAITEVPTIPPYLKPDIV